MNPEPLVRIFADGRFDRSLNACRVFDCIAGHLDWRVEAQDVAAFLFTPYGEARDHGGAAAFGELCECQIGAGLLAEELHERGIISRRILIDENADGLVVAKERVRDRARKIALREQGVTGKRAPRFDEIVNQRIIQRAHDDAHFLGEQGVGKCAEFPVAQMRGGEQDTFAVGFRLFVVLKAFVLNGSSRATLVWPMEGKRARATSKRPMDW